jgi:hypothetical protein
VEFDAPSKKKQRTEDEAAKAEANDSESNSDF